MRLMLKLQFSDCNYDDDDDDASSLAGNCGGAGENIQVNQRLRPLLLLLLLRPSKTSLFHSPSFFFFIRPSIISFFRLIPLNFLFSCPSSSIPTIDID